MTTLSFSASSVPPLSLFVAKNDIRFYLNGMYVTPAPHGPGCVIAATNGHQMALWHDPEGVCTKETILTITKPLIKACQSKDSQRIRLADGQLSVVSKSGASLFVHPGDPVIDAKYPNIWHVIPAAENLVPGMHGSVAPRLLRNIGKAGKLVTNIGICSVAVYHFSKGTDGDGSIVSRFEREKNLLIVTMPVRSDGLNDEPIPYFFKPPVRPSAEATANFPTGSMGEEVTPE